jgi:aryl-alcohol dehydrogenase-like predicted oxidoreductase
MQYVRLGKTGVKVSRICLGTAFRGYWHGQNDERSSLDAFRRAIDLGCNFIDCANIYFAGRCEELVGKAIKEAGNRDDLVITSKVRSPVGEGPNDSGSSRLHIMREVEKSLKRMQLDHIDLYQLHAYDPETPLEETFSAMNDLVRQGKIRYVGVCNFSAAQVMEALWTAEKVGLDTFASLQSHYNLLRRWEIEPELMPLCRERGLGLITFSPLAVGLLTGRFRRGQPPAAGSPWESQYNFKESLTARGDAVIGKLVEIAGERNATPAQIAIAWILDHPEITAPIIGPDLPEHVEETFGALEVELTEEERQSLDGLSQWVAPSTYLA